MIYSLTCRAFDVPLSEPESDGTIRWSSTGVIVVTVEGAGNAGLGYAYTQPQAARAVVEHVLRPIVLGSHPDRRGDTWLEMRGAVRNMGAAGIAASAISAVDIAILDLAARSHGMSVSAMLGAVQDRVPAYGSGGFTSLSVSDLSAQLAGWVADGMNAVKMKVGRDPEHDIERVEAARRAIGDDVRLMVDANGAYTRAQAIAFASGFADYGVSWFEEPVSSDDTRGLRDVRRHAPPGMEITAGEYGWDAFHFRRLLEEDCVDVLQVDATRCCGASGFTGAERASWFHQVDLSAHTAPTVHAHLMTSARRARHVEYFHDHVLVEQAFFDGALTAIDGELVPDPESPGFGLVLKAADVEQWEL